MMDEAVAGGVCFLAAAALLLLALVGGCVRHEVTAPQLDAVVEQVQALQPPVKCQALALPPVPQQARLLIDGERVDADAGGEQLLRGYVRCYSAAKAAR